MIVEKMTCSKVMESRFGPMDQSMKEYTKRGQGKILLAFQRYNNG